jgi:hypothetical protein
MSRAIEASFAICDHLNPGFGYQVRITDALSGESLLFTSKHPAYGTDLLTAGDCMDVINAYIAPEDGGKPATPHDAIATILEAAGTRRDQWQNAADNNGPSSDIIDEIWESGHDESQAMADILQGAIDLVRKTYPGDKS